MYGEIYLLPQHDTDYKRKFISDDNTYILALDGDTDFQPKAVILLLDRSTIVFVITVYKPFFNLVNTNIIFINRLRMYTNVGAACGRIHPTGMGKYTLVWPFLAEGIVVWSNKVKFDFKT